MLAAPYENLSKLFRNAHHLIEKEMAQLTTSINELVTKKSSISKTDAAAALDKMLTRLRTLKKKVLSTLFVSIVLICMFESWRKLNRKRRLL